MAPQRGTGRAVAMEALTTLLEARSELAARVAAGTLAIFDPPGPFSRGEGIAGDDGASKDLLWIQDSATAATIDVEVFTAADPVNYDETFRLDVVIQSIRRGSAATMSTTNRAAEEILGEVVGAVASNAQIVDGGASDPTEDGIECVIVGRRASAGWLPDGTGFGTRIELELELEARFALE